MFNSVTKWFGGNGNETGTEEEKQNEATETEKKENTNVTPADDSLNEGRKKLPAENENESKAGRAEESRQSTSEKEEARKDREKLASQDTAAHQKLGDATTVALDTAKQVGSVLYNFGRAAGSTVVEQASKLKTSVQEKGLLGSFSQEQEKFATEKKVLRKIQEDAVAPWVGYNEEATMKEQILGLSMERRHFLKDPPSDVKYEFDFSSAYPVALATLREDTNLRNMRFQLVPKSVSEERFWRNYFYRVSLIKQSVQLKSLEQQQEAVQGASNMTTADHDSGPVTLSPWQSPDTLHVRPDPKQKLSSVVEVRPSKEEEEEEEIGDDWERVLEQDVEGYVTVEGGGGGGADSLTLDRLEDDAQEDDQEVVDLLQQIEEETGTTGPSC